MAKKEAAEWHAITEATAKKPFEHVNGANNAVTVMGEYGKNNQKAFKHEPFIHASPAQV